MTEEEAVILEGSQNSSHPKEGYENKHRHSRFLMESYSKQIPQDTGRRI